MITITQKGSFDKTNYFLGFIAKRQYVNNLDRFAREGVDALSKATPVDSGKTSESWDYEIHVSPNRIKIEWTNSNIVDGVPVAILVQYGHGTRSGTWVEGVDFINPALQPVMQKIADEIWNEVRGA